MNKTLRKAIILRSKLKNRANKSEDTKNIKMYMQQRILVVRLNIHILATSILGESQTILECLQTLFWEQNSRGDASIMLVEREVICSTFYTYI